MFKLVDKQKYTTLECSKVNYYREKQSFSARTLYRFYLQAFKTDFIHHKFVTL